MRSAVFLDRDGVINELVYYDDTEEWDSPRRAEDLRIVEGVPGAIKYLNEAGVPVFVFSNQPGIAKGKFTLKDHTEMIKKLDAVLQRFGGKLDGHYYCLHHEDPKQVKVPSYLGACECRKPKPGLLEFARKDHGIDLRRSWVVGDRITDIQAGLAVEAQTILIDNQNLPWRDRHRDEGKGASPHHIVRGLAEAVEIICEGGKNANRADEDLHRFSESR